MSTEWRFEHKETDGEARIRHLLRELRIPFLQEKEVFGHQVDFLVNERLVIEVDGFWHIQKGKLERDHRQDARLKAAGYHVLRIKTELLDNPADVRSVKRQIQSAVQKAPQEKPCGAFMLPPDVLAVLAEVRSRA
ncbi:MAG: endonuclease domain-containing protein [Symbiobacteriia bacterium]